MNAPVVADRFIGPIIFKGWKRHKGLIVAEFRYTATIDGTIAIRVGAGSDRRDQLSLVSFHVLSTDIGL